MTAWKLITQLHLSTMNPDRHAQLGNRRVMTRRGVTLVCFSSWLLTTVQPGRRS
jgi:hypothetical protein